MMRELEEQIAGQGFTDIAMVGGGQRFRWACPRMRSRGPQHGTGGNGSTDGSGAVTKTRPAQNTQRTAVTQLCLGGGSQARGRCLQPCL